MERPQLANRGGYVEIRRWDADCLMLEQKQRNMQQRDYKSVTSSCEYFAILSAEFIPLTQVSCATDT